MATDSFAAPLWEGHSLSCVLVEQRQELLRGTRDYRAAAADYDRPLHQLGMLEQQIDNGGLGLIILHLETQFLEPLVVADQFEGRVAEDPHDLFQCGAVR